MKILRRTTCVTGAFSGTLTDCRKCCMFMVIYFFSVL